MAKWQALQRSLIAISLGTLLCTSSVLAAPLTIGGELSTAIELATADPNAISGSTSIKLNFDQAAGPAAIHGSVVGVDERGLTLDEAYLDYFGSNYDLRVGQQRIVWGTALEVNPTDVINPINITDPLGDKLPVMAVNSTYYLNDWLQVTGVYLPHFKPALEAIPNQPTIEVVRPESTLENSEYAVKLKAVGVQGADFSVSYFSGWEDTPTLLSPGQAGYRNQQMIGADLATAVGDVGLWAEAALTQVSGVDKNRLSWIVGGDYRWGNGLYLAAQYAQMEEMAGKTDLIVGALEQTFAGIHSWKIGALYNVDTQAYALMPELTISLADSTNLILGAKLLENSDQSLQLLGQTPSQLIAKLEMSF